MEDKLKPCPCGKTPHELNIGDAGQGGKWAWVNGDCCGEWNVEFRTDYHDLDSDECMELAITGWEDAPRGTKEQAITDEVKHLKESIQVIGFMLAQEKAEVARFREALEMAAAIVQDAQLEWGSWDDGTSNPYTAPHAKIRQLLNSKGPAGNT